MTLSDAVTADIEVVCPGMLEVLSVGKGDIKLVVGPDPADIAKARKIIGDMLRAGYGLFVEQPDGSLTRVKRFNAKTMAYVIAEVEEAEPPTPARPRGRPRKVVDKHVPVAGSKAKAIGRTAGG